jgi:hypothetical protein
LNSSIFVKAFAPLNGCTDRVALNAALVDATPEQNVTRLTPSSTPRVTDNLKPFCNDQLVLKSTEPFPNFKLFVVTQ